MLSSKGNKKQGSWLFERTTSSYWMALRKWEDTGFADGSTRLNCFEYSLWKRLWASLKATWWWWWWWWCYDLLVETGHSYKNLKQITMQQNNILNNFPNTTSDYQPINYKILYVQYMWFGKVLIKLPHRATFSIYNSKETRRKEQKQF
jgi:hypothetical protein